MSDALLLHAAGNYLVKIIFKACQSQC